MPPENTAAAATRNPAWNRDELILALHLYLQIRPRDIAITDPRLVELSRLLNSLPSARGARGTDFRNPNAVKMKCANFRRFDPLQKSVGLTRGNRLEEVVWNDFAGDPQRLAEVVRAIRQGVKEIGAVGDAGEVSEDFEFAEGRVLTQLHRRRERDPRASSEKKSAVLKTTGRLACEACGFDFQAVYGDLGKGFAECHHRLPLASLTERKTTIKDLAILCANCHRMIHRTRPLASVEDFAASLLRGD